MNPFPACPDTDPYRAQPDQSELRPDGEISSATLFCRGRTEVLIEHRGEQYRLRQTRSGKLILTK